MTGLETVLEYLPVTIRQKIDLAQNLRKKGPSPNLQIEEIRLRSSKPLILKIGQETYITDYIVKQQDILQAFEKICENSVYSYRRQICDGYITIRGGNRVGIVGSAVIDNGQVININYISSLNFRIAREQKGCSNLVIREIIDETNNSIYNTLIVSPPGCGKTTFLRDIIRNISNGIKEIGFQGKTVGVVDERGEIAAMYKGVPQNDVGIRTDIIENVSKNKGIHMLIRTMAPEVIACDEIGSKDDVEAIHYALYSGVKGIFTMHAKNIEDIKAIDYAMCCGVKGIFTAHGKDLEELNRNPELTKLLNKHIFERIILLNQEKRGDAKCIYL